MKMKLLSRLLCALLSVLMLVCMIPAVTVSAAGGGGEEPPKDYTKVFYESAEERLAVMEKFYDDGEYSLYCDTTLAVVAYRKNATGEILFTNPWDMKKETSNVDTVRNALMSQIILTYVDAKNVSKTINSFKDAVLKGQTHVSSIKNGLRVEYAIGETSARILVPMRIEATAFEKKILTPLREAMIRGDITQRDFAVFNAYYSKKLYKTNENPGMKEAIAKAYPIAEKKNIDLYVYNSTPTTRELRRLEAWILACCPAYTFEEMDNDYDFVEYEEEATSPPVFRMALEYTVEKNGLAVNLSANGLRYDETAYRITDFEVLPYMGASYKMNDGYSFIPDGSGTLYELDTLANMGSRVYGEDYSLFNKVSGLHTETMRMPVYGQVEFSKNADSTVTKRGFLAIVEEGESNLLISPNHVVSSKYASVIPTFTTRQSDVSKSNWEVYAFRRYTGNYAIRYIILSDDKKAQDAALSSYYECSWMGMACAYRDYLDAKSEGFNRLTAEKTGENIPLYIETFGCVDTIKKVLSMPVTVSVPLTSFDDIGVMYDYLAGNGVKNVRFKLTGYANGGLYSDVPYKLKWERSVGGKRDFKKLIATAAEKGFGVYPDFDFVYTTQSDGGSAVRAKRNLARTIDNRYTSLRSYSATKQSLVSYFQMVLSPATYNKFYEKVTKKYEKYGNKNISLSTLGNSLNSDYDEDKTILREEAKGYVIEALNYFKQKDYDVMVEGGNAFVWDYVDHILAVPLDSSRYTSEYSSVPFMGVVLHGYVQFAGAAFNMEGDLKYAMLKAMENGAGIYFILSYANTELLKEDPLLSQNYSVRYDIWRERLVEIYKELNGVLADVQTKLIIDHRMLEGTRIPDDDELLHDIEEEAKKQAERIQERVKLEGLASSSVAQSRTRLSAYISELSSQLLVLKAQLFSAAGADTALTTAWKEAKAYLAAHDNKLDAAHINALSQALSAGVAEPVAKIRRGMMESDKLVAAAKKNYDYLVDAGANAALIATARADLSAAIDSYMEIINIVNHVVYTLAPADKEAYIEGDNATVRGLKALMSVAGEELAVDAADLEAYLFGNDTLIKDKYADLSPDAIADAIQAKMEADGLAASVKLNDLISLAVKALVVIPVPPVVEPPVEEETEEDTFSKYDIDNNIVYVTYGEKGAPYKSFLLNFNDYAVRTVVNGVTYTIEAYAYVVIYH